jgi:anti-sigma factor RsiW
VQTSVGDMEHLSTESIMAHLDGKTPDAEVSPVEAHLAACDECSESMRLFQGLELRLRMVPRFRPPADAVKAWLDQFPVPSSRIGLRCARSSRR